MRGGKRRSRKSFCMESVCTAGAHREVFKLCFQLFLQLQCLLCLLKDLQVGDRWLA